MLAVPKYECKWKNCRLSTRGHVRIQIFSRVCIFSKHQKQYFCISKAKVIYCNLQSNFFQSTPKDSKYAKLYPSNSSTIQKRFAQSTPKYSKYSKVLLQTPPDSPKVLQKVFAPGRIIYPRNVQICTLVLSIAKYSVKVRQSPPDSAKTLWLQGVKYTLKGSRFAHCLSV